MEKKAKSCGYKEVSGKFEVVYDILIFPERNNIYQDFSTRL